MARSLADVQHDFVAALRQPDLPVPEIIGEKGGKLAKRRFDVYRNNVVAGITEALRATYPAVVKLVGDDFFAASARLYADQRPPHSPLLFHYGEKFGDFLDSFPPAASTPYLGDVARLEWARLVAYHARDSEPLSIEALGACLNGADGKQADAGRLRFVLHPSIALMGSRWPVVSLWAASTGQGAAEEVDMARSETALVIRPSLTVETRRLTEAGFAFMSTLQSGATLAQAAAKAIELESDFDLATHLQGLFALGAVSSINDNTA